MVYLCMRHWWPRMPSILPSHHVCSHLTGSCQCNSADDMEFILRKQRRWNTLYKMRQLLWLWFCETEPGLLSISSMLIMLYMTFLYGLLQYKLHMGATGMRVISYSPLVDRTCCKYCINLAVHSKQNNLVQEKLRVIFIYLYIKKCYCKYFVKFVNTLHVFFDLNDLQGVFCFDKLWLYSMYKNTTRTLQGSFKSVAATQRTNILWLYLLMKQQMLSSNLKWG